MAIKNKDGSVYKLRGPNPLMKEQSQWNRNNIRFFNLGHKSETVKDDHNPIEAFNENVLDIGEMLDLKPNPPTKTIPAAKFIEEAKKFTPEPVVDPEPKPVLVPVINVSPEVARIIKERGVKYHCAPQVSVKTHTDKLYSNTYTTPVYGDQFVFDAIVLDESDLEIQIWSLKHIPDGSIFYQKAKDSLWEGRWWRTTTSEPKTGGFTTLGHVSDVNPDFS